MTSLTVSFIGVASLLAHLFCIGAGLVLAGIAFKSRFTARIICGVAAAILLTMPFLLAETWVEQVGLGVDILLFAPLLLGLVIIREDQVGVVIKKFAGRSLPAGDIIALNGEAGYQADTLPPGVHFGYGFWQYTIAKSSMIVVPPSEIALVVAAAGVAIPAERILGQVVACDDFQDARKFLTSGGEKGRQLAILTSGAYRINPALFQVITARNAEHHGMESDELRVYQVRSDMVGIVMALDGRPIEAGEIAGPVVDGHDNFQNAQAFLISGGRRGLQEQVLLSGSWNLNPWFVQVEQVPMLSIPIGSVGVVISFVGLAHEDVSGLAFKHGDLVNVGHKGVWVTPLNPGKHPINTRIMRVELVPTTNIVLNWASLIRAYQLIGYTPKTDYSFLEINRYLRDRHPEIIQEVITRLAALDVRVERDPKTDLLTLDQELTVSLVLARCLRSEAGTLRWMLRFEEGLSPDLTIAVRMDETNQVIKDYYLFPAIDLNVSQLRLGIDNPAQLDAYRFDDLEFFFHMAERVSVEDAA